MDHSMMNHSMPGHNMSGMDPHAGHNMGTTMDPHAGHNMGGQDPHAGHGGHGGMKMYFHVSTEATVLFSFWKITTAGGMVGSCIGIFFLAMLYEGLKVFREYLLRKGTNPKPSKKAYALNSSTEPVVDHHEYVTLQQPKLLSLVHIVQTLLHILQITVSYFLMLIFMTYNVWLCIAVALGAGAGYFVFGWKRAVVVDINEHCH